jgi:hypothetical protein
MHSTPVQAWSSIGQTFLEQYCYFLPLGPLEYLFGVKEEMETVGHNLTIERKSGVQVVPFFNIVEFYF